MEKDRGLEHDVFAGASRTNEGGLRGRRGAECGFEQDIGGCIDADFEEIAVRRFTIGTQDVSAPVLLAVINGFGRL